MQKKSWVIGASLLAMGLSGLALFLRASPRPRLADAPVGESATSTPANDSDEDDPIPPAVTTTRAEIQQAPQDVSALGGENVLIADRGNNRVIEVTADKRIVWEYAFRLPHLGLGADDAFFADQGRTVITNLEQYHVIQQIDYATGQVTWQYGTPGIPGSRPGYLNAPDDAYKLANGDVMTADIKNCRVIEIAPDKMIVRQYGIVGRCGDAPGLLNRPNGDTPLPNGHVLVSNIWTRNVVELDERWQPVLSLKVPVNYPSDPQPTRAGNILLSDYSNPGKIIEISRTGKVVWEFAFSDGERRLNKPSLAIELPNGNILCNDDFNHRVIVINKQTNRIVWQYGVTGKPGRAPGQLNVPDGVDVIQRPASPPPTYSVGYVIRHPDALTGIVVTMKGYRLKDEHAYLIVSDEARGPVTKNDLPVTGPGLASVRPNRMYVFTGRLIKGGLAASNGNPFHFELTQDPE